MEQKDLGVTEKRGTLYAAQQVTPQTGKAMAHPGRWMGFQKMVAVHLPLRSRLKETTEAGSLSLRDA